MATEQLSFGAEYIMQRIDAGKLPDLRRTNIANGKQARVVRIADYVGYERPCVAKFCGGEHKGYSFEEAQMLIRETQLYYKELQEAGVKLPVNQRIQPVSSPDGSWQIVMIDEHEGDGEDLKVKLLNGYALDEEQRVMFKILDFLNKLPDGESINPNITCPTKVLGDFKPDNWVLRGDDVVLIDYFGPKRWAEDGLVTPYLPKMDALLTREAITFLCGDRRGQFGRIMAMAKRTYPKMYDFTIHKGLAMLKKDHPEAYGWVKDEVDTGFQRIDMIYQVRPEFWSDKV